MYSGKVSKWNKFSIKQDRNIIITNLYFYHFKKKKIRRIVALENLAGLTKLLKKNSGEFVIHVKKEHDYRLHSEHREIVFEMLKITYLSVVKDNLPIFGIAKANKLIDFATTESDVSRGISRMPLVLARIYEEDIKFDTETKPTKQKQTFKMSPSALQREQLSDE